MAYCVKNIILRQFQHCLNGQSSQEIIIFYMNYDQPMSWLLVEQILRKKSQIVHLEVSTPESLF